MSLEKSIEHKKEHRKPYYGAKAVDKTCRNHGSCQMCQGNRRHKHDKRLNSYDSKLEEYQEEHQCPICKKMVRTKFNICDKCAEAVFKYY